MQHRLIIFSSIIIIEFDDFVNVVGIIINIVIRQWRRVFFEESSAPFLEAFTMLHDSFDSLFSVDFRVRPIVSQNLNIEMEKKTSYCK